MKVCVLFQDEMPEFSDIKTLVQSSWILAACKPTKVWNILCVSCCDVSVKTWCAYRASTYVLGKRFAFIYFRYLFNVYVEKLFKSRGYTGWFTREGQYLEGWNYRSLWGEMFVRTFFLPLTTTYILSTPKKHCPFLLNHSVYILYIGD